ASSPLSEKIGLDLCFRPCLKIISRIDRRTHPQHVHLLQLPTQLDHLLPSQHSLAQRSCPSLVELSSLFPLPPPPRLLPSPRLLPALQHPQNPTSVELIRLIVLVHPRDHPRRLPCPPTDYRAHPRYDV
ncbi:unnamed protein product, partial [Ectocarpus sp. 8 AP-2014]